MLNYVLVSYKQGGVILAGVGVAMDMASPATGTAHTCSTKKSNRVYTKFPQFKNHVFILLIISLLKNKWVCIKQTGQRPADLDL